MFKQVIGVFFFLGFFAGNAQTFENIRVIRNEDRIIVTYDLISTEPGGKVNVRLYSSFDNYSKPVSNASGDIGLINPGPNKRITWLGGPGIIKLFPTLKFDLQGDIIEGWKLLTPSAQESIKTGKTYSIKWKGGSESDIVSLYLITVNQDSIAINPRMNNSGTYTWNVPKNIRPGSGNVIRLTSGDEIIEQRINIKRKSKLVWYAIPVIGISYLLYNLGLDKGDPDLPDAPLPN